ncbi:hypothetical protein Mal4_25420 [Maioricimonas rarisocia]|uniref:RiboL-PSP-HEPN domain-containing protein n=1 Tax=Maioricimonas rarisocia TaxID=2528026 RepID=A0A517Z6W0_9PLAN|nr:hypothetical protein [Maioricimonas rarisocia]QDU38217.1 hypothetical protein Mal4_25420 [Maioricimonas rarisocia]
MGMDEWEAQHEAAREEYEREVEQRTLSEIKENAINYYFFYYGDDIQDRIRKRIDAAKELATSGFYGESLTSSMIAVELTIRWFLLRPLCEASFMSEDVADILVRQILPSRSGGADRDLLPKMLKEWGTDITSLELSDGSELWESVTKQFIVSRNRFIHRGETVERETAEGAVDAAERLLTEAIRIVTLFARRGEDGWAPTKCRRTIENM